MLLKAISLAAGCAEPGRTGATATPAPPPTIRSVATVPTTSAATAQPVHVATHPQPAPAAPSGPATTIPAPAASRLNTPAKPAPLNPAASCPATLPNRLASTGGASQLITVEQAAGTTDGSRASMRLWQKEGPCWQAVAGPWPARLGPNGFSDHHREGDGTTPTGLYGIGPVVYGNAPNPGTRLAYHALVCGDWWDEDPISTSYNTFQHVPCGQAPPFGGNSEALWTETVAYPSFAVVDYNTDPVVPYAGSAIFVHADDGGPTNGCVSVSVANLDYLLRWLDLADGPAIVMAPSTRIVSF
jgi:L,D-peptidoglycan transpeptidase YkuD (ErfK/YbiS/YcfS/YnhG family)